MCDIPEGGRSLTKFSYFVEKADKFLGLSIFDDPALRRADALADFHHERGWDSVFDGPNDENLDAAVLTLRFFIRDNESTSLRRMTKTVEASASAEIAAEWSEIRGQLHEFLQSDTNISIEEGRQLTHGDVLDLFVWGDRAHGNDSAKRQVFKDLSETPLFPVLQVDFVRVLWAYGSAIRALRTLVRRIMQDDVPS